MIARACLLVLCLSLVACGGGSNTPTGPTPTPTSPAPSSSASQTYPWNFNGSAWVPASGTPPACPTPVVLRTPVDLPGPTSVLYPGQARGGAYKPHGGFRFDRDGQTDAVPVVAPIDGMLYRGARHVENGEEQILIEVINPCGIMFRLDHLREVTGRFKQLLAAVPLRTNDSRPTLLPPGQMVTAGEQIATRIGMAGNAGFDFGVYDLRQRNPQSTHDGDLAAYAVCWFDWLPPADAAIVRSLPPGDGQLGSTSDLCR